MIVAHILWGFFPIYWRQIDGADSAELVCHRILWSFVSLGILLPILLSRGAWGGFLAVGKRLKNWQAWKICGISAALVGINWLAFTWAVNHDQVLQASLGYYINPLFNVVLGVVVLGERLERVHWVAVMLATIGVAVMTINYGGLPWIALTMASSFACYGLVKKRSKLPALIGLFLEVTILLIPAGIYLAMRYADGINLLQTSNSFETFVLLNAGIVTITPLAFFALALQRVPLSLMGILQYIGPTLQFLVGAFLYDEPLSKIQMIGFVFVWLGSIVFLFGPAWLRRRNTKGQR